jgi:cysteinyl-tRNA synthetase
MNITDVGHLESNSDYGFDKISEISIKKNRLPWEIASYYKNKFFLDCKKLNIIYPSIVCKATNHINDMINMIKILEKKKYSYIVNGNIYYNTKKFNKYKFLFSKKFKKDKLKSRIFHDKNKINQEDFVLWFSINGHKNQIMKWESPWGIGFPGWHIECSAMSYKYFGKKIDIHAGGVDHISIHNKNEIAQSESCFNEKCVNFWLHSEFLIFKKNKMSKSGKCLTLSSLKKINFNSFHYRYFCLNSHYRSQLVFRVNSLVLAKKSFESFKNKVISWKDNKDKLFKNKKKISKYKKEFWKVICNDMNTPSGLSILWKMSKDKSLIDCEKLYLAKEFDLVFGFGIEGFFKNELTRSNFFLVKERECARKEKNYKLADQIRIELLKKNIGLKDYKDKTDWYLF